MAQSKKNFKDDNPAMAFISSPQKPAEKQASKETKKQDNKETKEELIRVATYMPKALKKAMEQIALDDEKKLYEVMNEALTEYAQKKGSLK